MESQSGELRYVRVDATNLNLALKLRTLAWPNRTIPEYYCEKAYHDDWQEDVCWLVYRGDDLIGLAGVYTIDEGEDGYDEQESIWMDSFMIVSEFRRQGFGRQVLSDVFEYCKGLARFKYFRLDTTFWEGRPAVALYDKMMDLREKYDIEKPENGEYYLVYSKALGDWTVKPWNNRFLGLNRLGMSG